MLHCATSETSHTVEKERGKIMYKIYAILDMYNGHAEHRCTASPVTTMASMLAAEPTHWHFTPYDTYSVFAAAIGDPFIIP